MANEPNQVFLQAAASQRVELLRKEQGRLRGQFTSQNLLSRQIETPTSTSPEIGTMQMHSTWMQDPESKMTSYTTAPMLQASKVTLQAQTIVRIPGVARLDPTQHASASQADRRLASSKAPLCTIAEEKGLDDVNGRINALTVLLNSDTVREDPRMRNWIQNRLLDAERERRQHRRQGAGTHTTSNPAAPAEDSVRKKASRC